MTLVTCLLLLSQDPAPQAPKVKNQAAAYDKAVAYVRKNLPSAGFPQKMIAGFMLLADGRYPEEVQSVIQTARQWDAHRKNIQHAQNWFPALAGMFLCEAYKFAPKDEIKQAMQEIVDEFVKKQEKTGGWFKWYEGAVKDMPGYPVRDLGILDAAVYGVLLSAKSIGCKVPDGTLQNADRCLQSILSGRGISYGTGQNFGDPTGARGGFAMLGLDNAGQRSHAIWTTYVKCVPDCISKMDKGHHIGAFHCLGLTIACRFTGNYPALLNTWGAKLAGKQDAEGGLYVGDDGADGGESGLLGNNIGSTAAFAFMLALQDPDAFKPAKKKAGGPSGGPSPFSQKKEPKK